MNTFDFTHLGDRQGGAGGPVLGGMCPSSPLPCHYINDDLVNCILEIHVLLKEIGINSYK